MAAPFEAKANLGMSFESIAMAMGKDEIWVAAVFYGQAKLSPDDLESFASILGFHTQDVESALGAWPNRGLGPMPPTDPLIYRLYEGVLVYGHPIKAVIQEKFGDGIMSMVDCKVNVAKKFDPNGDRVLLTFDGKFLPYATW